METGGNQEVEWIDEAAVLNKFSEFLAARCGMSQGESQERAALLSCTGRPTATSEGTEAAPPSTSASAATTEAAEQGESEATAE